jgi:hypothetical protein
MGDLRVSLSQDVAECIDICEAGSFGGQAVPVDTSVWEERVLECVLTAAILHEGAYMGISCDPSWSVQVGCCSDGYKIILNSITNR